MEDLENIIKDFNKYLNTLDPESDEYKLLASFKSQYDEKIKEKIKRMDELKEEAMLDGSTGILNHKYFFIQMDKEIKRSEEYNHPLSVAAIDVDDFKEVNDGISHKAGDTVLKYIAEQGEQFFNKGGYFARYGGDEFGVIMPKLNLEMASERMEDFRQLIENSEISYKGHETNPTITIGVYQYIDESPDDLWDKADKQLYRGKKELGKNRVINCKTE